jgi:hypothetical protein
MKPKDEKAADIDNLDVPEIKLERVPVENLAEVTETLDRVRVAAQKLVVKLTEATDRYAESSNETRDRIELGNTSTEVGKTLSVLNQGLLIVLAAATAKKKLNSGK